MLSFHRAVLLEIKRGLLKWEHSFYIKMPYFVWSFYGNQAASESFFFRYSPILFCRDYQRTMCSFPQDHSQLRKRERTGTNFLYRLDWNSTRFNWNVSEWKATQPSLRAFRRKLFKWEPRKVCKIPYKSIWFCGLSTQSIQTLYFRWYLKSYHFAIFLL